MKEIVLINHCPEMAKEVENLITDLTGLDFKVKLISKEESTEDAFLISIYGSLKQTNENENILILNNNDEESLLEKALRLIPFDFDALPHFVEGESKIIRKWTSKVVIEKFKPTVYSFTHNRYGTADGTDSLRIGFTSKLFRQMAKIDPNSSFRPQSAFLAEIKRDNEHYLVQRLVDSCNLEVRIKRYHIGSPIHRYLFTEEHETTQQDKKPLTRWSRFDTPVVCFDWRLPLTDKEGKRLADEPISDDYASIWMNNIPYAKEMSRNTFLWLEDMFAKAGICLIDMCIFVDKSGKVIYGEISPDCMRTRIVTTDLENAEAMDKDLWRTGKKPEELFNQYTKMYDLVFS